MEQVKKRDRRVLIVLMVFLSMITVGVAGYFVLNVITRNRQATVEENKEYLIYWNADKEKYMDIETGASTRQADKDKKFTLRFVHDGKVVEYRARTKKLVYQVDARDVMGLEIDENGFITEVIDIEDFTGGYAAIDFFVESMDDKKLVANSSTYFSGEQLVIKAEDKVPIYDVSAQAKTLGEVVTTANLQDRLTAVKDESGEVLQAFITERSGNDGVAVLCPHCNEEVKWKVWNSEIKLPSVNGHWKLKSDIHLQDQGRVAESNVVVLDLNGYVVYGNKDARIYCLDKPNGALNIVDLSSAKTGKLVSNGTVNAGSCVYLAHGIFEMYGGTLDASKTTSTANGTAVALSKDTTFNMYGGTIIGGTAQATMKADLSGTSGGSGGSVNVAGVFQMYDGTIKDGKAKAYYDKAKDTYAAGMGGNVNVSTVGEFYMYGGEILNGVGQRGAGNVQICKGAKASMENGLLSGGVSEMDARHGGNLYIAADTVFTMTGGKIEKGVAGGNGGNVICYGTLNMSGGSITGGKCLKDGKKNVDSHSHNMYVYYGNLVMSGGLIDGYVHVNDSKDKQSTVTLSGTAKITGGEENLYLAGKLPIVVKTMKDGADIGVSAAGHFSEVTAVNNTVYFHSDYDRTEILHIDNKLFAGRKGCVCGKVAGTHAAGCSTEDVIWMPWMKSTSMPTEEGNYYLTCDVGMHVIQATIKADSRIALDLNGYTVLSPEGKRIYSTNNGGITFSITDTSEKQTGCLKSNSVTEGDAGLCVWVSAVTGKQSQFNLYAGTLDASTSTSKANGCAIAVTGGCTFNMYGGKIVGGTTKGSGGSIYTKGDVVMYAGTISGGKAPDAGGGNILIETGGSFILKDGLIENGESGSHGGNVYVKDTFKLEGGIIFGGKAAINGGNIFLGSRGETVGYKEVFTMSGGSIKNGVANGATTNQGGGNVFVNTRTGFNMNGGEITGGKAQDSSVVYNETTQKDETKYASGGNVLVYGAESTFIMSDGTIASGKTTSQGGNICVRGNGNFTMTGGQLEKGQSNNKDVPKGNTGTAQGGNLALVGGIATISGGTIANGSANIGTSSNVYINNAAQANIFTMSGGEIKGKVLINGIIGAVTFTGSPVIYNEKDGKPDGAQLTATIGEQGAGVLMNVYDLKEDANIWISSNNEGYFFTSVNENTKSADANQIHFVKGYNVGYSATNKQLYVGGSEKCSCYCGGIGNTVEGHTHVDVVWKDWTKTNALPSSGSYRLTVDVTLSAQANVSSNQTLNLDLNGHTITNSVAEKRILGLSNDGAVLNIVDTSGNYATIPGTIKWNSAVNSSSLQGSLLYMNNTAGTAMINLWKGVLDGSGIQSSTANGPVVNITQGTLNMYGGTIIGGKTTGNGGSLTVGGSALGTFNMYAGTIKDGDAGMGGNIHVNTAGIAKLYGGIVSGGNATQGGNISISGEVQLLGATLSDGTATTNGGNVFLTSRSSATDTKTLFKMTSGLIENGTANGKNSNQGGGNVYINIKTGFEMSGGIVSGGNALGGNATSGNKATGGNVMVMGEGSNFAMTGGTITAGKSYEYGGNVCVRGGSFVMSGQSALTNGEATNHRGGNLGISAGIVQITGGTISGGKGSYSAGKDIYIVNGKTTDSFTMSGVVNSPSIFKQGTAGNVSY